MNPDTYVAPVFNRILDKAERHIKYIVSTSSYVGNLQKKREVLNAKKNDVNERMDEGERSSQRPTNEVVVWRSQAVDMLDRIDTALDIAQETGSCICSICSKHKLGYSCDGMIKEVDDLLERASLLQNVEMVDCDTSNIARPMPYVVAESQEQYFAEACKCIEDDNSKANIIGIWGLGGVGKTTLLTKIHNHFVGASSTFETVIWTVASSEQSNIFRVQSEIVKKLRLQEGEDVQSQAALINRFLNNKNFLLFIDDLWEGVDLHKVGVPDPNEGNRCGKKRKVIFTTRSKEVCGNMEARKIIEVKCLDTTQSWALFTEKVGNEVIQSHPEIPKLTEHIAEECKGLPLALIIIGRAMSTKSNIDEWKSTLNLLKNSQGHHVSGVDKQLLPVLKISYDYLATEQLRNCFLTISMWPEDHIIYTYELIDFWMGIDLIDNFESKHELYQIGYSLIRKFQAACLLDDVEYDPDQLLSIGGLVKMHDVLRDLALWLASECGKNKNKWIVKSGIQLQKAPNLKPKWRKAECISLMHNNIEMLPSDLPSSPSLLTLLLGWNQLGGKFYTGKFDYLNHLDLSHNRLHIFPESICYLTKLRYLNLSSNDIENLPMELRNLKMLKYLILRRNNINNIPKGVFVELAELLVLDMFDAVDTAKYRSVDVEELRSIEKNLLYFGTSAGSEEELSKLMLLSELPMEDLCISGLHGTTFHLMAMVKDAHRLRELCICWCDDLLEITFDANEVDQEIASLNLETLELWGLNYFKRIIWKHIAPEVLFVELQNVCIGNCPLLEDITWVVHLRYLKFLSIWDCKSMRIAINNDMDSQILTFPSLEMFRLTDADKLEKISIRSLAFPQLKQLRISNCPLLKALPFEVETTPKLRKIKGKREWWEEVEWEDDNSRSHFNQFFYPLQIQFGEGLMSDASRHCFR